MSESKEKNKELYLELTTLDEQVKNLHAQIENIDEQLSELNSSKVILNKFSDLKVGDELRVPLASGVYIKAKLTDIDKLLVNVGAGVSVEKTPVQVIEILDGQVIELMSYREKLVEQMKLLITRVEKIQKEVEKRN